MKTWTRAAASALVAAACVCTSLPAAGARVEPPPVFTDLSFEDATAQTAKDGKVLIVKATAEWCGPCKMMDRTTWRDEKVVRWVRDNAVAIQVDVDQQREVSQALRVRAMPTMVAFKEGKEFDRVVGYRDAGALLEWMEAVKRGERAGDALLKRYEKVRAGELRVGMQERMQIAQGLTQAGEHEKATEEYLWLWERMAEEEPAMVGVRASFLPMSMGQLAAEHEPAKRAFARLRDDSEARLRGEDGSWEDLHDWIALNDVVGEPEKTLEWFDRVKDDPGAAETIADVAFRLERLLEEHERWTDLIRLYPDPLQRLRREHGQREFMLHMEMPEGMEDQAESMRQWAHESFRDTAGKLYGACLAAERASDADRLAEEAMKLDATGQMRAALVRGAVQLGQPREIHRAWLDEARQKGADAEEVDEITDDLERAMAEVRRQG